jgi:hypothetical protein
LRNPKLSIEIQTDTFLNRPPPLFLTSKTGVDIETQVEEEQLFHWNFEAQPIVGKPLQQSFLEVREEEEFPKIRRHKGAIEHSRNVDLAGIQRLEEGKRRKFEEKLKSFEFWIVVDTFTMKLSD